MRLTKGETNELLDVISKDNYLYGLIFKLIYVYGKDGVSVLSLKWEDIDFVNDTIIFKNYVFPLHYSVRDGLYKLSLLENNDYVFLINVLDDEINESIDIIRKKLRYYLGNNIKKLNVSHKIKHVSLSITDLRRLRGQHLLLDGVSFDLIMKLYLQKDGTSTQFKKYLEYDDLMNIIFPCEDLDDLFNVYTDLTVFEFESHVDVDSFAVAYGDDVDFMIYIDGGELGFVGDGIDDDLKDNVLDLFNSGLLDGLFVLGGGEYKVVDDFSFVRI